MRTGRELGVSRPALAKATHTRRAAMTNSRDSTHYGHWARTSSRDRRRAYQWLRVNLNSMRSTSTEHWRSGSSNSVGLQIDEHEAARRAGVSVASWRKWEAGTVIMQTGSFLQIGRAFGVSFDWLSGFDELRNEVES